MTNPRLSDFFPEDHPEGARKGFSGEYRWVSDGDSLDVLIDRRGVLKISVEAFDALMRQAGYLFVGLTP